MVSPLMAEKSNDLIFFRFENDLQSLFGRRSGVLLSFLFLSPEFSFSNTSEIQESFPSSFDLKDWPDTIFFCFIEGNLNFFSKIFWFSFTILCSSKQIFEVLQMFWLS